MARTIVNIVRQFEKPREMADLVVFSDRRNYVPDWDSKEYLKDCARYAKNHGIFLVPSRFVIKNQLFSCLIAPGGEILGVQPANHLSLSYKGTLHRREEINVIHSPLGELFLAVDVDIFHPEVVQAAKRKGAQIVVANPYWEAYQGECSLLERSIWNMAQLGGVYVVGAGSRLSAIAAPWEVTPDQSGYLVAPTDQKSVLCKLFLEKLQRAKTPPGNREINREMLLCHRLELTRG